MLGLSVKTDLVLKTQLKGSKLKKKRGDATMLPTELEMMSRRPFEALNALLGIIGEVKESPPNFDWENYFKKGAVLILAFENLDLGEINWFLKFLDNIIKNPLFTPHLEALRAAARVAIDAAVSHMELYGTNLWLMFTIIKSPHATEEAREETRKMLRGYLAKIEEELLPPKKESNP